MKHIVRKVLEILGKHRTKEVHVLNLMWFRYRNTFGIVSRGQV